MEILFTSVHALLKRNKKLPGVTSIWMFPIYGMACLIKPVSKLTHSMHWLVRGTLYMSLIFSGEYLSGKWLCKRGICPWDYSKEKWNIDGIIRLDYAPFWFIAGLAFEHLLAKTDTASS